MSWTKASGLARQIAERYDRSRCVVTVERRESFRRTLLSLDQALLVEWLHTRLAQEFRAFAGVCRVNARAEDGTDPEIPSLLTRRPK